MDLIFIVGAYGALPLLILVRNELVYRSRTRAMDIDLHSYLAGPSYNAMMLDLRKWTFKQFYPHLDGRKS